MNLHSLTSHVTNASMAVSSVGSIHRSFWLQLVVVSATLTVA